MQTGESADLHSIRCLPTPLLYSLPHVPVEEG